MGKQIADKDEGQNGENIVMESSIVIKRAAKNSLGLITSQFLSKLLGFAAFVFLARYLSENEFGVFNYAFAFWAILASVIEGGFGSYVTREVARNKEKVNQYLTSIIIVKIFIAIIIYFTVFF